MARERATSSLTSSSSEKEEDEPPAPLSSSPVFLAEIAGRRPPSRIDLHGSTITASAISTELISSGWSRGLVGKQLDLGDEKSQHIFEKPVSFSEHYAVNLDEIGHGAFGICVPGGHLKTKTQCTVKIVIKDKAGKGYLDNMEEKGNDMYSVLLSLDHTNIVKYYDFLIGANLIFIIMEPLGGPELFEYIIELETVPESYCRTFMKQVLAGVSYCHEKGVIHRDVKLENFRFRHKEERSHGLALLDFGLCCPAESELRREVVGTLLYTAPEMFRGEYGQAVDMWATGVMLYVMLTGTFPFDHHSYEGTDNAHRSGRRLRAPLEKLEKQKQPVQAVDLVKSLLVLNPENRLRAADALNHAWFSSPLSEVRDLSPNSKMQRRHSLTMSRTMSSIAPQLHGSKLGTPLNDLRRLSLCSASQASRGSVSLPDAGPVPCAALKGTLAGGGPPINVIFLDVDGVLAPCVNSGQIVKETVSGVVMLSKLADAKIVLTSSWRLLEGKVELLNDLLKRFHSANVLYDVSPDLYSTELPEEDVAEFDAKHFVRTNDKKGFSSDNALAALKILGITDEASKTNMKEVFSDPDFDLNVYSEEAREYTREVFSPRSRRAADWVHEPCSVKFAETRCKEIMLWLHLASKAGVSVKNWVVLDDDDLLRRSSSGYCGRERDGAFSSSWSVSDRSPMGASPVSASPMAARPFEASKTATSGFSPLSRVSCSSQQQNGTQPTPAPSVSTPVVDTCDDDDDPWAMAF